jgi:hypothetical protein
VRGGVMGIGINEIVKVCKENNLRCSESSIRRTVISMILNDVFTDEQLKKIAENTYSNAIRIAAEMKLKRMQNSDIIIELAKRL